MKIEIIGKIKTNIVTVAGTWDPFVSYYSVFFAELIQDATSRNLEFCPIIFDPKPVNLRRGPNTVPEYDSLTSRINYIRNLGAPAVIVVKLDVSEIDNGVEFLIQEFSTIVKIKDLWIGPNQSLGPLEKGTHSKIKEICLDNYIEFKKIPYDTRFNDAGRAINHILKGEISEAIKLVGHYPSNEKELKSKFQ